MNLTQLLNVGDASQIGEARRFATGLAADAGFDETSRGRVALIATELATNLVQHGHGGDLLINRLSRPGAEGLEILTADRGPGMPSVARCMEDGYSTGGTAGEGLGAVGRLAQDFEVFSLPGQGTIARVQIWSSGKPQAEPEANLGAISIPYPGEQASGDGWAIATRGARTVIMVVDGLGHGLMAEKAAHAAIDEFHLAAELPPAELIHRLDLALRRTRGAAVAVAELNADSGVLSYAGVGNISAVIVAMTGDSKSLASQNGIVGHDMRRVGTYSYDWAEGSALVLHSDGLRSAWRIATYPGLLRQHPSLLAAALFRDALRGRDDATVVAFRPLL